MLVPVHISLSIFFFLKQYSIKNPFGFNFIPGNGITTKFCTCHDSTAVVSCANFCSNDLIRMWVRTKWNVHWIWIRIENRHWNKPLVAVYSHDCRGCIQLFCSHCSYPTTMQYDNCVVIVSKRTSSILQSAISNAFCWMKNILIQIPLNFVLKGLLWSVLVWVMVCWCQISGNPLPEPKVILLTDVILFGETQKCMCIFIISRHYVGACRWNRFSWNMRVLILHREYNGC